MNWNYILKLPYLFKVLFLKNKLYPEMCLSSRIQNSNFSIPNKGRLWRMTELWGFVKKWDKFVYGDLSNAPVLEKKEKPKTVKQFFEENKGNMFQYGYISHARIEGYNWFSNRLKIQVFNYGSNTRYKAECLPSALSEMKNMSAFY